MPTLTNFTQSVKNSLQKFFDKRYVVKGGTEGAQTVKEDVTLESDLTVEGDIITDRVKARSSAGLKLEDDGGSGMHIIDGGQVGVGMTPVTQLMEVNGNIGINASLVHNGDVDTLVGFTDDKIQLYAGGLEMITCHETGQDEVIVNEGGIDVDFRAESVNQLYALFVDAANDRVGMNTPLPFSNVGTAAGDFIGTGLHVKGGGNTRVIVEGDVADLVLADTGGGVDDKIGLFRANNGTLEIFTLNDDLTVRVDNLLSMDMGTGLIGMGMVPTVQRLEVAGNVGIDASLVHNGDVDTLVGFTTDKIQLYAGGIEMITCHETGQDEVIINEGGIDVDFRAESVNQLYALFVDASTDNVGVSTATPLEKLSVNGNIVIPKASSNGIKVDLAAPTFGWRDLKGKVTQRNTGASKPTHAVYRDTLRQYQFSAGEEEYFTFHIDHDHFLGSDIFLHVHWSHTGAFVTGGTITIEYEISYAKGFDQEPFSASVSTTFAGTASTTQYQHIASEVKISAATPNANQIDSDRLEPDGVIETRIKITANNITVSEGDVPDPFIHEADIHYQSTGMGTKAKAPNFYA